MFNILLFILFLIYPINSYKILGIFPYSSETHFQFINPVMERLAIIGHDVTVISKFTVPNPPKNYRSFLLPTTFSYRNNFDLEIVQNVKPFTFTITQFGFLTFSGLNSCKATFNSTALKSILNSNKTYDALILEQYNTDCMMAVAWKLNAPVIAFSSSPLSSWHFDRMGNPSNPAFVPSVYLHHSERMSFHQRLINWFNFHLFRLLNDYYVVPKTNDVIREYLGDGIPSVSELVKSTNLMFVNQHYSFSGSRPLSPSVIDLMGLHLHNRQEPEPLDADLQAYLDSSINGVIYVCWGTAIRMDTLRVEKRDELIKAFGSLKQNVLWKWESDSIPNKPSNVRISKWLPQLAILCHPNVKVFMTHGGSLSATETIHCAVPVVVTPIVFDQYHNAAAYENRGIGVHLDFFHFTNESISDAINAALEPNIQKNMDKVSYAFKNRLQTPLDLAIWWVEYVAATKGTPLLKSHSVYMPWWSLHLIDIYLTIIIIGIVLFVVVRGFIKICRFSNMVRKLKMQ